MTRTSTRRTFTGLAVGIPGLAALYACTPGGAPPAESPVPNAAIIERQTGGKADSDETETADAGGGTAYDVSMVDLAFEPPDFTIPANTDVTVTVVNKGQLPHYWQIIDQGIETPETQEATPRPTK